MCAVTLLVPLSLGLTAAGLAALIYSLYWVSKQFAQRDCGETFGAEVVRRLDKQAVGEVADLERNLRDHSDWNSSDFSTARPLGISLD
ncbi:hypothetical protein [Paracoccus sp. NSM]|uniref:hypothetical protein n=1 Tax=Paracoccus sp. NSM TaxID=3457784 RepID=UPI004035D75C